MTKEQKLLYAKNYREKHKDKINNYAKKYRIDNKKIILLKAKEYYQNNKQKILIDVNKYYDKNQENILIYKKKYRNRNKDKIVLKSKEYYKKNRKNIINKNKEYEKNKLKKDKNLNIIKNLRSRINFAIKSQKTIKFNHTINLIGCSIDFLKNHLQETAIKNGYNNFNINKYSGKKFHIDHIIPCSAFNLTCSYHQKLCFNWSNMQILTAKENLIKSNNIRG